MRSSRAVDVLWQAAITTVMVLAVGCNRSHDDQSAASSKQRVAGECTRVELNASRTYSPSRWTDADQSVSPALTFALPSEVMVTSGASAHQWSELSIQRSTGA